MDKLVTVILPTYNASGFLGQWKQKFDAIEGRGHIKILAIDNGSTDGTQEFLTENILFDEDVFVQNETNLGHGGSSQKALHMLNTPYCIYVNADDYLGPSYLKASMDAISKRGDISITFGHCYSFNSDNPEKISARRVNFYPSPGLYSGDLLKGWYANFPVDAGLLVKTEIAKSVGGFTNPAWFALAQHNQTLCFINVDHMYSGKHQQQESKRFLQDATSHQIFARSSGDISNIIAEWPEKLIVHELLYSACILSMPIIDVFQHWLQIGINRSITQYCNDPNKLRSIVYEMSNVCSSFFSLEISSQEANQTNYTVTSSSRVPLEPDLTITLKGLFELSKQHNALPSPHCDNVISFLQYFQSKDRIDVT
jgi:glycosyltransferase involved in cell wall biosynthesis